MIRRPPRSTQSRSSAASDVYKRQLLLFAYRAAGGSEDATLLACAPEVIHSYSLMHDDLPCMDDDDMRRGRPTVHKVYGSRTAILGGVAMIPLAARVVRDAGLAMRLPHRVG